MIRLLIADDNTEFRKSTEMMVSLESDIQVVSLARDGQEAVEMAKRQQPDVALIDVHMPKVDGLAAIRTLANTSPHTVCMAMSYDGEREILRQAMAAGAREYLIKPFSSHELVNAVRRVASHSTKKLDTGPMAGAGATPLTSRVGSARGTPASKEREQKLKQLSVEYLRADRMDPEAKQVYAELVTYPTLDASALATLAEIFLQRRDWATLHLICERMEQLTGNKA